MLYIEGLQKIEKIKWKEIQPGMIFLGGVRINDAVPFELRNFPVLTPSLLEELVKRYHFLTEREIIVVKAKIGYSPSRLSREMQEAGEVIEKINNYRTAFLKEKEKVLISLGLPPDADIPLLDSDYIEKSYLIKDRYNSFSVRYSGTGDPIPGFDKIPSFFHAIRQQVTLGHLLTGQVFHKFNLPKDEKVLLHIVVDFSYSMERKGKLGIVLSSLDFFYRFIKNLCKNTEIKLYAFSDECKPVQYPLSGKELPRKETQYASFIKKVLHFKDTERHNKVILFTDGEPTDKSDALFYGKLFKKNNIDYTQIIFSIRDEMRLVADTPGLFKDTIDGIVDEEKLPPGSYIHELSDPELEQRLESVTKGFTGFAETCNGNQVIVKINDIAHIIGIECYDRYLGLLTLADPSYIPYTNVKNTGTKNRTEKPESHKPEIQGKVIKKWQPKIIRKEL